MAISLGIAAVAIAGCSVPRPAEPDPKAYVGQVRWGCAPHDAASVELELITLGGSEVLSLNLWGGQPYGPGRRIEFGLENQVGAAGVCNEAGVCQTAGWGRVIFDTFEPGRGATGLVRLGLSPSRVLEGSFSTAWIDGPALCG